MAEMFLKLHDVDGESIDDTHHDEIEIKSWSWTNTAKVNWEWNQGGQATKVDVQGITLDKLVDKATVTLYQNCVTGKHIPSAMITCRKNDGEQKFEYLHIELKDVMVKDVVYTGDGENQAINEKVTLSFAEFKVTYKLQKDSGTSGGGVHFGYHIQKQHKVA